MSMKLPMMALALFFVLATTGLAYASNSREADFLCSKVRWEDDRKDCQDIANQFPYFDPDAVEFCTDNIDMSYKFGTKCLRAVGGKSYSTEEIAKLNTMVTTTSAYRILDTLEQMGRIFTPPAPIWLSEEYNSSGFTVVTANTPAAVEEIKNGALAKAKETLLENKKADIEAFNSVCLNGGGEPEQELNVSCRRQNYMDLSGNQYSRFNCGAQVVLRCQ